MDKQKLKQLIKDKCNYLEATIDYVVNNTEIQLIPTFKCLTGNTKIHLSYNSIFGYLDYFFNQIENTEVLINNKEVDISNVLTKFKVGDVVYYFDKHNFTLIRGEITSIDNHVSLTQDMFKGPYAYSQVGIKRLDEDVDFVVNSITNSDLFLTIDEATETLINNTFRLEQKRKQDRYNQLVQDELNKFSNVNDT
jgi:hypothetical protein